GSTVSGLITNSTPAQAFSFEATAGTTVNVVADAQTGSLDTAIALYGPGNNVVATNEDASEETTDSAINATLTEDGTYVVIVSRYALSIGGTEGEYTLTVTETAGGGDGTDGTVTGTPVVIDGTPTDGGALAEVDVPAGSIEVALTWNSFADVQLLIRDPNGDAVYDDQ